MSISLALLLAAAPQEAPHPELDPICMEAFREDKNREMATSCTTTDIKDTKLKRIRMEYNISNHYQGVINGHGNVSAVLLPDGTVTQVEGRMMSAPVAMQEGFHPTCLAAFDKSSERPYATACTVSDMPNGYKSVVMAFDTPTMRGESSGIVNKDGKIKHTKSWAVSNPAPLRAPDDGAMPQKQASEAPRPNGPR